MAVKLAEERINNTGCDFDRYNGEFAQQTVGCAYLPNNENVVVLQNSSGRESLHSENTAITPLTTATNEAETRMNRGFAGGGHLTSSPTRLLGTRSVHLHSDFR